MSGHLINSYSMRTFFSFLFFIFVTLGIQAQGGFSYEQPTSNDAFFIDLSQILKDAVTPGAFDEETRTYFIDFENYLYNIKDIVITDLKGDVVFKTDTRKFPVDSIVDFDFNHLPNGYYTINIDSYIGKTKYVINI